MENGVERKMIFFEMAAEFRRAGFAIGIGRPLPVAILIDDLFSIVVATSATDPRFDLETFVDEKTYFPTIDRSRICIYIYLVSRSILCSSSTMKYVLSRIERADVSVEEREEGSPPPPLRSQILSTRDKIAHQVPQ